MSYNIYLMNKLKTIIIIFLLGACVLSISRYITAIRENSSLQDSLEKQGQKLDSLEIEKQNLLESLDKEKKALQDASRKNLFFKGNLKVAAKKITALFSDNAATKKDLRESIAQVSMLRAENEAIRSQAYKLKFDLIDLERQKEELESRFNSIPALKKAIKELKLKSKASGNRGFLFRRGVPDVSEERVKIEVSPDFEAGPQ